MNGFFGHYLLFPLFWIAAFALLICSIRVAWLLRRGRRDGIISFSAAIVSIVVMGIVDGVSHLMPIDWLLNRNEIAIIDSIPPAASSPPTSYKENASLAPATSLATSQETTIPAIPSSAVATTQVVDDTPASSAPSDSLPNSQENQ
jgi:hypothetical protein